MATLTIRIKEDLKEKAFKEAEKLGIPLTFVVTNSLMNFVKSRKIVIGESEIMEVTPLIQKKMNKIGKVLSRL